MDVNNMQENQTAKALQSTLNIKGDKLIENAKPEEKRNRIAFFVRRGGEAFLDDIINDLAKEYETNKIIIKTNEDLGLIDKWMDWADICWFEWCEGLIIYGSKLALAKERKIICRLHSYEAFSNYPSQVNWNSVDKLIFVAEHIQKFVIEKYKINKEKTIIIPNGVNINKWVFKERNHGFKVAYVGYINYKKGPMLLLHTFKAIYDRDNRYKFYIAGQFQDLRDSLYFQQMTKEFGLENNFFFEGWQQDLDKWLEDKNYIVCTSVLESQNMSVMQAIAKGIKPILHNFAGAKGIYPKKYLWNTIDEAVKMITEKSYDAREYRKYIEDNYSLIKQLKAIKTMINELITKDKMIKEFNYQEYWNQRLHSRFNIEGVGYLGLGEIYNKILYQNRIDMLDGVINKAFDNISNKKVLELGPGIGIFTDYFHNKSVKEYYAIDIVEKAVCELSNKYKNYHFKQGDISDGHNYEEKYDLIFAAAVLLHITNEDNYKKTIINISKHLKDNGICILLEPISVINTKSEAPHVIIRDKEYVKKVLEDNNLELIEMLPVAYFMNYPFDRGVIGSKGSYALEAFNLIRYVFSNNIFSNDEKQLIGEYLLYKEKQLLYQSNFGLSEKLLIIQKKEKEQNTSFNLKEILDIDNIKDTIRVINENLNQSNIARHNLFNKINEHLYLLEKDGNLSLDYIQKKMNEFIPYNHCDFDNYNFNTAQVIIGKREKIVDSNYEVIEFILKNQNSKLICTNIWYDLLNNRFILPDQMRRSKNSEQIIDFAKKILSYDPKFTNNIAGFIFDQDIIEDVRKNSLAYVWERGIPASQYMPLLGYLRIVERYTFAAGFMNKSHKVLEAPCGFGYGAAYFSKICKHVDALDIAEDNIAFAKEAYRHENINWVNGNVTTLPYSDNEFDIYVSYEVFEHLPIDLVIKHIEEGYRVIKKSGKFIISTPNKETRKHINNPFHVKEYEFNEFNEIIKKYFNNVKYYSVSNFQVEEGMKETAYTMIAVCEK